MAARYTMHQRHGAQKFLANCHYRHGPGARFSTEGLEAMRLLWGAERAVRHLAIAWKCELRTLSPAREGR